MPVARRRAVGEVERGVLLGLEGPAQRSGDERAEQGDALLAPAGGVERVEPHLAARSQADRPAAEPLRERPVLALRVDHDRAPAEEGLAGQVGLDERRLALADLPGDQRRRAGDGSLLVEHPRVEAEARSGVDLAGRCRRRGRRARPRP